MKFNEMIQNQTLRKGIGVASTLIACIAAVGEVISNQKKEEEFEEMKKQLAELQEQKED